MWKIKRRGASKEETETLLKTVFKAHFIYFFNFGLVPIFWVCFVPHERLEELVFDY
jgi:hypothetical protein